MLNKIWSAVVLTSLLTLGLIAGIGCAGDKGAAQVAPQGPNTTALKNTKKDLAPAQAKVTRSVFTIDGTSRDPFNPQSRKAAANSDNTTPQPMQANIPALLREGLQGISGTTGHHIAIINNVLLEAGQPANIPVRIGNQFRSVPVRCREVARNSVTLDVEGYGPVSIKTKHTF